MTVPSGPVSSSDIFQNSFYVGTTLQNILYGAELVLYFKTMQTILSKKRARRKSDTFYAVFSSVMMFSITIWVASQAWIGEEMWLLNPDFSGGPNAYWQIHASDWYMDWSTTSVIVLQLITDGLMIHRCRVVWDSYRVIVIPMLLWLVTLALGALVAQLCSSPGGDFFSDGLIYEIGIAYYTFAVFLNTFLTCMICHRIMRHGQKVREYVGHEEASVYFTVTTMVVESVLPYTISGIAFLVSYGMGSPTSAAFISVYMLMMCISPQILVLRVIVGRAWDNDTSKKSLTEVQFDFGMSTSQVSENPGVPVRDLDSSSVSLSAGEKGDDKV